MANATCWLTIGGGTHDVSLSNLAGDDFDGINLFVDRVRTSTGLVKMRRCDNGVDKRNVHDFVLAGSRTRILLVPKMI